MRSTPPRRLKYLNTILNTFAAGMEGAFEQILSAVLEWRPMRLITAPIWGLAEGECLPRRAG
jgi:hypothetical protein